MVLREANVKARVINYFTLCDDIILQHGLSSMFLTPNGIKEKCTFLKQYLEPVALRDAVDTHHRLVDSSSKSDEQALYQLVKDKTLEQEKHSGEGSGKSRREPNKGQRSGANQGKAARVVRNDTGENRSVMADPRSEQNPAANAKSKPKTGCFHCGKDHWLSQCPDLDESAKEALLAERKAKKGLKATRASVIAQSDSSNHPQSRMIVR
ncbi:hypothetical protein V7S43_014368 [Phytophthora oleae]|uniref:CCHC-type domain-containing protein n=1 Tax=Phytophthora oleae TaxID=2107226 RepID=A0ABD3F1D5_9STRA